MGRAPHRSLVGVGVICGRMASCRIPITGSKVPQTHQKAPLTDQGTCRVVGG